MVVKIYGNAYICACAVKGADFVWLYDANNNTIIFCEGIKDFTGYEIEGGIWSKPKPNDLLAAQQTITTLDLALIAAEQSITDNDLRLLALEAAA